MKKARIAIDKYAVVSEIDPRIYGSFIEHLGRAVYEGIYQPGQKSADEDGFREDTIAAINEIGVPLVRYPGGDFLSGYRWEDGVGPKEQRPRVLDFAWHATETNQFGLNEFMKWRQKVNAEPMMAVNLGTRGLQEAKDIVEYCNHPGGTQMSDWRRSHGVEQPYGIKLWCLGNEMDGPWQIGHRSATEYGRVAEEVGRYIKKYDPTIKTVVCGSSGWEMPTFGEWEREVLMQAYDVADYLSLHMYWRNDEHDIPNFLANSQRLDDYISSVIAVCDAVKCIKRSDKTVYLSFDEWNVWYHNRGKNRIQPNWPEHPRQEEEIYDMADALLVGSALITFLRHADRIKIACMAQLVNVIAPIMTSDNGVWRNTTFYPYMHASQMGRGKVLQTTVLSPTYSCRIGDKIPYLDAVVVENDDKTLTVFAVNKSLDEDMELVCDLHQYKDYEVVRHIVMTHEDLDAVNTEENPNNVLPHEGGVSKNDNGDFKAVLGARSWNVIRLAKK